MQHKNMFIISLAIIWKILFESICIADTININSGEIIKGVVVRYSKYATEIYSRGEKKTIQTDQITGITTDNPATVSLDNGEKIIGLVQLKNDQGVVISQRLGDIPIQKNEISAISTRLSEKEIEQLNRPATPKNTSKDNITIGKEDKAPPMDYLRGSTVLRKPGEAELALTVAYDSGRYDNPVISTLFGILANETRHRLMADLSLTVGITERLEGWVDLPYQWNYLERVEGDNKEIHDSNGIGDISFGFRFLALGEGEYHPSITLSLDAIAPTGENPYNPNPLDSAISTGDGHWSIRPGIGFVNTTDPLVFFYGVNYKYNFPAYHYGKEWDKGDSIGYYGGVGFAVNDRVSLSTRVIGEHKFESKQDGKLRYGTSQDPVSLGFSVYYRTDSNYTISPFVNVGISKDAPDYGLGLSCAKTF